MREVIVTPLPVAVTSGARMKTAWNAAPFRPVNGNIRLKGFLLPPECIPVNRHIHKSQRMDSRDHRHGLPSAPCRRRWQRCLPGRMRIGSKSPFLSMSREIVVDSPPGMARALHSARSAGLLTSKTSDEGPCPIRSSASRNASICSLTFPCSASTPILASTGLQHLIVPEGVDIETGHGIAKTGADLCDDLGIVEVVDRFHDRFCHALGA